MSLPSLPDESPMCLALRAHALSLQWDPPPKHTYTCASACCAPLIQISFEMLASRISRVTPFAFSRLATQARWTSSGDYPTIPDANRMPRNYRELTNESIAILALEGLPLCYAG